MAADDENRLLQEEEIAVLGAIYSEAFTRDDNCPNSLTINIKAANSEATLHVSLPSSYPTLVPPVFTLSAHHLSASHRAKISEDLQSIYLGNIGSCVIHQWISSILDFLNNLDSVNGVEYEDSECENESPADVGYDGPEFMHGDPIVDRKSIFQAHVAVVNSKEDADKALSHLRGQRKICDATHNIFAYRITNGLRVICDSADDGEREAGKRLLQLLSVSGAENVLVVVSRWYGGTHLGPDRFKHINDRAQTLLEEKGFITKKGPSKSPKRKTRA